MSNNSIELAFSVYPFIPKCLGDYQKDVSTCNIELVDIEIEHFYVDPLEEMVIFLDANNQEIDRFGDQKLRGWNKLLHLISLGNLVISQNFKPKNMQQILLGSKDPKGVCCVIYYQIKYGEAWVYFPVKEGINILTSLEILKEIEKKKVSRLQAEFAEENAPE